MREKIKRWVHTANTSKLTALYVGFGLKKKARNGTLSMESRKEDIRMKLNIKSTILVGLAFLTISAFWQLYDFYVPLILLNTFGIGDDVSGFIMSLDNIVALFLLPLFGMISDRSHTRIGRRMPYILLGTLAASVFILMIPYAAHSRNLPLFIAVLGMVLLSMAVYRSPAVALMPDITPKPLRSKGNAIINLMGAVGGAMILLLNAFLAPDTKNPDTANYWPVFLITVGIMLVGTLVLYLTVNEPELVRKMRRDSAAAGIDPEEAEEGRGSAGAQKTRGPKLAPEVRRSMAFILVSISLWFMGYNAVTTAFSKYAVTALGIDESRASLILMVAVVVATLAFVPVGILSTRIGRKKSILIGLVLLTAVFGTASLYTQYSPLMYVSFALAGIAWASINVNSLPMVLEMSKGASVGQYTGYYYTFSMTAQVITPILSGILLERVGYFTLMPYGALFVGLAIVTMAMVRHGDAKPVRAAGAPGLGQGAE
jgi:MFS family permease